MSDLRNRKIVGRIRSAQRSSERQSAKQALKAAADYAMDDVDDAYDFDDARPSASANDAMRLMK